TPAKDSVAPATVDKKPILVPPMPPTPSGQPLQIQMGMQFVQQSAPNLDRLDKEVQMQMLAMVEKMDERQFQNSQTYLQYQHDLEMANNKHACDNLKRVLYVGSGLGAGVMLIVGAITVILIQTGQPQLAHTVMMSGIGAVGCLLGGAGLAGIVGKLTSRDPE